MCENHPNKKGKYKLEDNPSQNFCSKCAIELVAQGRKIVENGQAIRQFEIQSFLKYLNSMSPKIMMTFTQLEKKRQDLAVFYSQQLHKVEQLYARIVEAVLEDKSKFTRLINDSRERTMSQFTQPIAVVKTYIQDCENMKNDIQFNLDQIVNNIEIAPFHEILRQYTQKCKTYELTCQSLKKQFITVLKFNGVVDNKAAQFAKKFESILPVCELAELNTTLIKKRQSSLSCQLEP